MGKACYMVPTRKQRKLQLKWGWALTPQGSDSLGRPRLLKFPNLKTAPLRTQVFKTRGLEGHFTVKLYQCQEVRALRGEPCAGHRALLALSWARRQC